MQIERQISWISDVSFYSELPRIEDRGYTVSSIHTHAAGEAWRRPRPNSIAALSAMTAKQYICRSLRVDTAYRADQRRRGPETSALGETSGRNRDPAGYGIAQRLDDDENQGEI